MSDQQPIEFTSQLPEGSIPTRAIEMVLFFDSEGKESCAVRIQATGASSVIAELGMLSYAEGIVREGDDAWIERGGTT